MSNALVSAGKFLLSPSHSLNIFDSDALKEMAEEQGKIGY
jgi:hypothetical protein